jgi:polyphosphate kinase
MRDLMEIATLDNPALHDPPHHPVTNAKLEDERSIFHIIRESGPILLQHPYESFGTSVERFVREASRDPKVLAIKMTLYRTSASTRIVDDLIEASRNGKQVAVVVEIKARFDEAANIQWANRLEEAGIHVMYGVVGLKTHSKVILVVRRDFTGLRRYAHIGTGNYHAGTARIYSDLGLLTCDDVIGADLTELFNYLTTGYKPRRTYHKILAAPRALKEPLLEKIDREVRGHASDSPGLIRFKVNALEDSDIVEALYRAAQAGIRVELIVRDTCRLRPGLPGLSETVTVVSIVGRFLEHGRIYYFRNGGDEEFLIGSADLMKRNLESRVEVVAPVSDPALCAELRFILDTQLNDRRSAWEMRPDGSYVQRQPRNEAEAVSSQQALIAAAENRHLEATRLRKRKPRSIARRQSAETV